MHRFHLLVTPALLAIAAFAACSSSSASSTSDAGPPESKDASVDVGPNDDVFVPTEDVVTVILDGATATCEVAAGSYLITGTPTGDAGMGLEGGACAPLTTTITFPLPTTFPATTPTGGKLDCTLQSSGMLPNCGIDFDCIDTEPTTTTESTGFIIVQGSSYIGNESVTVTSNSSGMQQLSMCTYATKYTKQ
jgi:hypothetical protein